MAHKRKITVKVPSQVEQEDHQELYDQNEIPVRNRKDLGWRHWVTHEYARYWYFLGAMFLDLVLLLEAYTRHWVGLPLTILVIALIGLVLIEVWGYFHLWGKGGRYENRYFR
jgi:hypothetical protein